MLRIRSYPHFDPALTETEALMLVSDPLSVSRHAFFPFIAYSEQWTKFAAKGLKGKVKTRPIRYAARRDSCIYSCYRKKLSCLYETELKKRGLSSTVLAYRRIRKDVGIGNKSNVHFANDVFTRITNFGVCTVYTLDISKFFDKIDHAKLKQCWADLLSVSRLPIDHYRVFRAVTRYASVDRECLYKALGYIGIRSKNGRVSTGYTAQRIPLQVCSGKVFRETVKPLIALNEETHGIPQGSPISDVLANLYLLDFDTSISQLINNLGGCYFRYSDDLLFIIPGVDSDFPSRLKSVQEHLTCYGENLVIQDAKSTVHLFQPIPDDIQSCTRLWGTSGKNGLEYLGFRFDGKKIFIRDSTRSRLQRNMTLLVNVTVSRHCKKNPTESKETLKATIKRQWIIQRFGKVPEFKAHACDYSTWTFWTYLLRAQSVFGERGKCISRQVRNFNRSIDVRVLKAIKRHCKVA